MNMPITFHISITDWVCTKCIFKILKTNFSQAVATISKQNSGQIVF